MWPETQERLKLEIQILQHKTNDYIKAALGDSTEEQKMRTKSWGSAFKD